MGWKLNIALVNSDDGDWESLYIDNELVLEDHSLDARKVLEYLVSYLQDNKSIPTLQFTAKTVKMDAYKFNKLPANYNDINKIEKERVNFVPNNLVEAISELRKILSKNDLEHIKKHGIDDLHFGLGMHLRNNWRIWHNSKLAEWFKVNYKLEHADDMSGIILETLYRDLNGKEWDVKSQAQHYIDYWKSMEKGRFDCIKEQYEQLSTTEFIDWCLKMKYPIEDILEVVKKCEIGKTLATITILCGITGLLIILILLLT